MFPQTGPQQQFNTAAMNQQGSTLLGSPPIQAAAAAPSVDSNSLNSTAFQSNPGIANMVKALKGGMQ